MEIVLGVSMTPTTVRMVLVEGEKADGAIVDHDVFDITPAEDMATSGAAEQVIAAVLGTQESAVAGGHDLKAVGVTWSDHTEAAGLRDALTARGIEDVMLVSEGHAAAALSQAVGRAVGYDTTALLFMDRDTATLSVVQTEDGSVVKVLSRTLHDVDAMAVLADMATAVEAQDSPPQGLFIVGSGVDVSSVKSHLKNLLSLPVSAPDEPALALARGAALASAHAPAMEASTAGLAYSLDPDDGSTAGSAYSLSSAATQMRPIGVAPVFDAAAAETGVRSVEPGVERDVDHTDESRKPFLLVGSALTSIFIVGVVALVISLAINIRPTADQRPNPAQNAIAPVQQLPAAPAPVPEAKPVQVPAPAPPPQTIKAPVPVAQQVPQAPPRTVYVEQPAAAPQIQVPAAPPAPAPVPVAPPAPVLPPPAYVPPVYTPPFYNPPAYRPPSYRPPVYVPPIIKLPPIFKPPVVDQPQRPPWQPPTQKPPWQPDPPQWDPPDVPQQPQVPQVPQSPVWPPSGGSGGGYPGSGSGSYPGSGGSDRSSGGSDRGDGGGRRGGNDGGSSGGGGQWPLWPFGGNR